MRNKHSFYAVWKEGMEWPQMYGHKPAAEQAARVMAKNSHGMEIHLLQLNSIATIRYPDTPSITGKWGEE